MNMFGIKFGIKKDVPYGDQKRLSLNEMDKRIEEVLRGLLNRQEETAGVLIQELKDLVGPKVEIPQLKKQLAELRLERTIEERDIKHLVKMKEEKLAVEHQKSELALKNEYKDKEMVLQTEYHDKVLKQLEVGRADLKEVYANIMQCLPNVNMQMRTGNPEPSREAEKKAD